MGVPGCVANLIPCKELVNMSSIDAVRPRLSERLRRRTTSGAYFPEIDGLRFLAIAPVILQHLSERVYRGLTIQGAATEFDRWLLSMLPTGSVGVYLFFVISGYIICLPLAKRAQAAPDHPPEFQYGKYMLRRLTRLEPPYLLVLGLSFLAVMLIIGTEQKFLTEGTKSFSVESISLPASLAASVIYAHGLLFHSFPRLNPPAWSLEIEFQFYVLAPAIILISLAVGRRGRSFAAEVLTMAGVVVAMKLTAVTFAPQEVQRFLVSNFVEFFVLGFVLSRLYVRGIFQNSKLQSAATPLFLGGLCLAWYADHLATMSESNNELVIRLILLTSFAAVFAGALSGGAGRRFTSATWIATIGGMCYTIYLVHLSFLQVATRVLFRFIPVHDLLSGMIVYGLILIPILLVMSMVFFLLIEKPCMDPQWPQKLLRFVRCLPPTASSVRQVD